MQLRRHSVLELNGRVDWADLLGLIPVVAILLCVSGCRKQNPAHEYYFEKIGALSVGSANVVLEENFYVPSGMDGAVLGISFRGTELALRAEPTGTVSNASRLKFAIQLFHADASNEFYRAEVLVASNCVYYPLWKPDLGYLLTGIDPFPYSQSPAEALATGVYRSGRDVFPLKEGKPSPGVNYRVRLSVLTPVPLTNQVQLWLYSHKTKQETQ